MNTKLIIFYSKIELIKAEHELSKGNRGNADKHLYNIYNWIHFGSVKAGFKNRKHRPPGKLKK